ncbi:sprouty-related, EVH1 domain-containing protein 2-like [Babylonia areolata]|uniref:sprouty-related, EVH1 domain-containing protein 2-like n=1 Tax=Babylonia areolata TaxID=304850 RepID=UPI003FD5E9AB
MEGTEIVGLVSSGDYLVEVQAQVMTRDDSTQCWVPMGGGGLSTVKLCKLAHGGPPHSPSSPPPPTSSSTSASPPSSSSAEQKQQQKPEYVIHGERLADKSVVLNCVLKKDILYTRANPKFHHWNTDEKRYGLTFERSDDAKAFDHGIRLAVAELSEGTESERIFQVVDLTSRKNSSSQSTSTTSTTTSSPSPHSPSSSLPPGTQDPFLFTHPHANHHHLHRVHYMSARQKPKSGGHASSSRDADRDKDGSGGGGGGGGGGSPTSDKSKSDSLESWNGVGGGGDEVWVRCDDRTSGKSSTALLDGGVGDGGGYKDEPYVIFDKNKAGAPHEYSYPSLEPVHKPPAKRESTSMRKTSSSVGQPHHHPPLPLPQKTKPSSKHKSGQSRRLVSQRAQCEYCRVMFNIDENQRGSCDSAPDKVVKCIEYATCVACASGLIYHCMADADGAYRHPCECDYTDDSNCKKWTALTILSFFIPCLWCYMPLYACHRCGTACGLCGGRHKAE